MDTHSQVQIQQNFQHLFKKFDLDFGRLFLGHQKTNDGTYSQQAMRVLNHECLLLHGEERVLEWHGCRRPWPEKTRVLHWLDGENCQHTTSRNEDRQRSKPTSFPIPALSGSNFGYSLATVGWEGVESYKKVMKRLFRRRQTTTNSWREMLASTEKSRTPEQNQNTGQPRICLRPELTRRHKANDVKNTWKTHTERTDTSLCVLSDDTMHEADGLDSTHVRLHVVSCVRLGNVEG